MKIKRYFFIGWLCLLPVGGLAQSLQLADSLRVKGEQYQERGNFKEAEFYYKEAFNLYNSHRDTAALLMTGVYYAEVLSYRSKMDEAIAMLKEMKSISHPANNDSLKARIESDLGWIQIQMGNGVVALNHYQKGLLYAKAAQDSLMTGILLNNLANTYKGQGHFQKALDLYNEALPIFEALENKRSQAYVLSHIGSIYRSLHLYDKALAYFNRSLDVSRELDNINLLAAIYDRMGELHKEIGNYDRALVEMQESLTYRMQTDNFQRIGSTLNSIGTLYRDLGNPSKALEYYRESLGYWSKISNPLKLAVAYKNIGGSLWSLNQHDDALTNYQQALTLRREAGEPQALATSLLDLAMVKQNQGDTETASTYLRQAQIIADSTQSKDLLKEISEAYGELYLEQEKHTEALLHFKNALKHSRSLSKNAQLSPLKRLAYAFAAIDSDSALYYGRKAIALIEEGRSQTGPVSQIKAGYFKQHADFYIAAASWLIQYNNDVKGAYQMVESAKARALTDELAMAAQRVDEPLPEAKRIERARKLADISTLYTQLNKARNSESEQQLKAKIRNKELAYTSFENTLQQNYPGYKFFKRPRPIALGKVQEMCDPKTAILEYAVSDQELLIFFITQNEVETYRIAASEIRENQDVPFSLKQHVQQFRNAIIAQVDQDSLQKLSAPIYDQLIAPFKNQLDAYENLMIVPDDFLAYLPFEALLNESNYLVSQFSIKYAPSMTGFSLITPPSNKSPKSILAISNAANKSSRSNAALLPTANREVQSLSKNFNNATLLQNDETTEENVKNKMQESYTVVHVAAHSVIDDQNSSRSGIILKKDRDEKNLTNDGYLRSSEIYRLNISSNLVVLSACQSAMGNLVNGEGMLGLQRAFLNAGASAVVVSLWDVYDRSTTLMMQSFYKNLNDAPDSWADSWSRFMRWTGWDRSMPFGNTPSSMRRAKLAMLNSAEYNHPVYWAPFVVVGR